ncbi:MAG: glycosyltransferase family 4 protein [Desulfobacteraceae bacterium]|jgi:glycosyltransferase involved in cell wall biosynthesis
MSKTIKIAFISPGSFPVVNDEDQHPYGGAETQMYLLSKELSKNKKFDVTLVIQNNPNNPTQVENLKIVSLPFWTQEKSVFSRMAERAKGIRLNMKFWLNYNGEVLVQRSAGIFTFVIWVYCKLFSKKFVYMVAHDWDTSNAPNPLNKQYWWPFFRFSLRRADLIVAQNDFQTQQLKLISQHVWTMENGVPFDLISYQSLKRSHLRDVVYIATRFTDQKQPLSYIKLAQILPQCKFTLVSFEAGEPELIKICKNEFIKTPNLNWISGTSWKAKFKILLGHRIYVSTSIREGFPNTFLEAAACKLPVVSLNVDPNSYLSRSGGGLCANGSWELFVETVKKLLTNPGLIDRLGKQGQNYAKEYNSLNILAKRFGNKLLTLTN